MLLEETPSQFTTTQCPGAPYLLKLTDRTPLHVRLAELKWFQKTGLLCFAATSSRLQCYKATAGLYCTCH
ncbi:UNVERIFIED_CONTAM: hypothetical protein FKN15_010654 [Acipenser sinensis]